LGHLDPFTCPDNARVISRVLAEKSAEEPRVEKSIPSAYEEEHPLKVWTNHFVRIVRISGKAWRKKMRTNLKIIENE